jgi:hypothetical protein
LRLESDLASNLAAQFIEDRAVWAIVASACLDETSQHADDGSMSFHPAAHGFSMLLGQRPNFPARSILIAPELEQVVDLLDWKSEQASSPNEPKLVNIALVERAIAAMASAGGR